MFLRQGKFPNLHLAASTADEPNSESLLHAIAPAGKAELWLLAAPQPSGARSGTQFLPLTTLPREQTTAILAAADGTVVFDADYLSWNEALKDAELK